MIAETSLLAYQRLVRSGAESTQRAKILAAIISTGGATRRQLAEITCLELGAVAGRVNALLVDGLIEQAGTVRDKKTGVHVQKVAPILQATQGELLL